MINPEVTNQWLKSLSPPNGKHKNYQIEARSLLKNTTPPTKKDENWRLSNFKIIENILSIPYVSKDNELNITKVKKLPLNSQNKFRIILNPLTDPLNGIDLPKGFKKLTEGELNSHIGKILKKCNYEKEWLTILNSSSIENIIGLKFSGKEISNLEIIIPAYENSFSATRIFLLLEEDTSLNLTEVILGDTQSAQSHLLEIKVSSKAYLNHGLIALGKEDNSHLFSQVAVEQESDSNYSFTYVNKGWDLSRLEPRIIQNKGNAISELNGLQISNDHEQISTHSLVRFNGPNGKLNQLQKSIAKEYSHAIFEGIIQVPQIAQKTEASQMSRNLLLSKRARIDTKPELEIVADDVRCTHGATISQLQEEELFYLQSRGINSDIATYLILKGFCQEIISKLPIDVNEWQLFNEFYGE